MFADSFLRVAGSRFLDVLLLGDEHRRFGRLTSVKTATVRAKVFPIRVLRWLVLLVLVLACAPSSFGCLWLAGTTKDGRRITVSGLGPVRQLRFYMKMQLSAEGVAMEARVRNRTDMTNRNDLAVSLIYQGEHAEAIEVLEQLEKERPGEYYTAANLGTAYELAGRDDLALKWIQEGIRRNPASHDGTEWLHVKILEAKLRAAQDPDYFTHHSVLDLDFSRIPRDVQFVEIGGDRRTRQELIEAFRYQLQERVQLVRQWGDWGRISTFDIYSSFNAFSACLTNSFKLLSRACR